MKSPSFVLLAALALPAASTAGQVVTDMTPGRIDEAISKGAENKPAPYGLRNQSTWVEFDTPFLRVWERAASAEAADRSVATPDLLKPELHVTAGPEPLGDQVPAVKQLLILRADGSSIKPTSQQSYVDYAQSRRRKKIELKGVRAVFPLTALEPGARFRLVMSDGRDQLLAPEASWFKSPR